MKHDFCQQSAVPTAVKFAKVMKHKHLSILSIICLFLLLGCTGKGDTAGIVIPEVQRVEDTAPGWFIKAMNLDYSSGKYLTVLMHEHLSEFGRRIDSFKDKNGNLHIIWIYYDFNGITDKYKKSYKKPNPVSWYWFGPSGIDISIEEKLDKRGETPPSFTFRYPPPGILLHPTIIDPAIPRIIDPAYPAM
ncbi:MAG: hypothetical protein SWH68_04600 [Thermodesulfobacteriota bacterium]|nr:hypothetical protein [Thermodesulfobacteriota bacterium]